MTVCPIPDFIADILARFDGAGVEAFCVGGCVRDALRGVPPHDWDLCTAARPEETRALFCDCAVIETGIRLHLRKEQHFPKKQFPKKQFPKKQFPKKKFPKKQFLGKKHFRMKRFPASPLKLRLTVWTGIIRDTARQSR